MNDCNSLEKSEVIIYNEWLVGLNKIIELRQDKGKTLLIGVSVPKLAPHYEGFEEEKNMRIIGLNSLTRSFNGINEAWQQYTIADCEEVPHDPTDDGLHFLPKGNRLVTSRIVFAIINGISGKNKD